MQRCPMSGPGLGSGDMCTEGYLGTTSFEKGISQAGHSSLYRYLFAWSSNGARAVSPVKGVEERANRTEEMPY